MNKILTVVIPTYNMQDYLRRCLDSLIVPEEQMKQMEVLVVNDGSKDNSSAIAHEYQDKYPDTFRVIDKENGNYGSCVNRGLKEATGKYIKVLDADDWFDASNFKTLLTKLVSIDTDVVITDYTSHVKFGEILCSYNYEKYIEYTLERALRENETQTKSIQMHAICYNRVCFEHIEYHQTEGISYTDQEWILEPWINVNSLYYIPLSVYQYNLDREGQTCAKTVYLKMMSDQFVSILNTIKFLGEYGKLMNHLHRDLIFDKIATRMESLYRLILVDEKMAPEYLINFDRELMGSYREFAEYLDNATLHSYFPCRYIKHWRRNDYQTSNLVLEVNSVLQYIADSIKSVVDKLHTKRRIGGGKQETLYLKESLFVVSEKVFMMSNPLMRRTA